MDVTLARIVQVEFAAIVELLNVNDEPPAFALSEADAPQPDNEDETGSARRRLAGKSSVTDAWVSAASRSVFRIRIVS